MLGFAGWGRVAPVANTIGRRGRYGHLHANVPVALPHVGPYLLLDAGKIAAAGVAVGVDRPPALAAEELIDGHAGPFAEDIPQRDVHAAERMFNTGPLRQ